VSKITKDTPRPAQIYISLEISPLICVTGLSSFMTSEGFILQLCKQSSVVVCQFRRCYIYKKYWQTHRWTGCFV